MGYVVRPRIDSFLWISEPKMSVLDDLEMEISISSPRVPNTCTTWTSMTGSIIVSPGIAASALVCGFAGGSVYSRQTGMGISITVVFVRFGLVYLIPTDTRHQNDASSQTLCELNSLGQRFEVLNVFPAICFQMLVLEKRPKSSFLVNWRSSALLCSRILLVREFFLVPSCSLSNQIVLTNSKLLRKNWADPQNEWFGTRVLCLKHPHWSVCSFFFLSAFSEVHDSMHWHL